MPSKEELLQSIHPDMKLNRNFFLRIYAYEISYPGFMEIAIKSLESAGCGKAKSYYTSIVESYERELDEQLKPIAKWLREKIDSDFDNQVKEYDRKQGEEKRKSQKTKLSRETVATEILKW